MSQQAFEKLMAYLPAKDRENINAIGMAYGLDFRSPEWIPFAISQHGLLSIQQAIVAFNTAIQQGSDDAIKQAVGVFEKVKNAEIDVIRGFTVKCENEIQLLVEDRAAALLTLSEDIRDEIAGTAKKVIGGEAEKAFTGGTEAFNAAKTNFLDGIATAEKRVRNINAISLMQAVGFSLFGSVLAILLAIAALNFGAFHSAVRADEQQIAVAVVKMLNQQDAAAAAAQKARKR